MADTVSTAHRKGIVHRDLKPDNITLGGEPCRVLEDTGGRASFSPDGSRFVFHRFDDSPAVSPHGRWAVYVTEPGEKLMPVSVEGGTPEVISEDRLGPPRVSPDGSRILGSRWHEERQLFMIDIIPFEDLFMDTFEFSFDGKSLVLSRGESSRDIVLIRRFR